LRVLRTGCWGEYLDLRGLTAPHRKEIKLVTKCYAGPQIWRALVNAVMNLQMRSAYIILVGKSERKILLERH